MHRYRLTVYKATSAPLRRLGRVEIDGEGESTCRDGRALIALKQVVRDLDSGWIVIPLALVVSHLSTPILFTACITWFAFLAEVAEFAAFCAQSRALEALGQSAMHSSSGIFLGGAEDGQDVGPPS
jgi:hypothetical protein